jgi:2-amino-4-hydroxy-6-hydroxymethyldihydropteridine diphosphokinase
MTSGRDASVRQAFVGAGANLGDRAATLRGAIDRLRAEPGIVGLACSSWYETAPVGVTEQPLFLNLVLRVETTLPPEQLLAVLQGIEHAFGRERTLRWGPRTLDLDLLAYEGERRETPSLTLPHPRLLERAFVLVPLRELLGAESGAGQAWDELRKSVAAAHVDSTGVRRV